jgi:thiamine biosynthesis protein ThiS
MALTVNGDPHPWHEGLTVELLLKEKTFTFPLRVIFVNQVLVKKDAYAERVLEDGDVVEVVHLIGGG